MSPQYAMTIIKKYYPCTECKPDDKVCIVCLKEPLFIEMVYKNFKCDCGTINSIEYELYAGDSLDFHCPTCGCYYKKVIRIRDDQFIEEGKRLHAD